jgi:hypothetical protein
MVRLAILMGMVAFWQLWSPGGSSAFTFGVNADNLSDQIQNPRFAESLKQMQVEFVVWHIAPEQLAAEKPLLDMIGFCKKLGMKYLFNTELVNYVDNFPGFQQDDGTYRWDVAPEVMSRLQDDPLFLGVVYDEPFLMQSLNGQQVDGRKVKPYFADTSKDPMEAAHEKVVKKIKELSDYYGKYRRRLVFEMVFPDYAHPASRGGALPAPKLLKENFNDLMFYVYSSAARQYEQPELWACVDLWFLDRFPEQGRGGAGHHSPEDLLNTLNYAFRSGFDYVYIEHVRGLLDDKFNLSEYGKKVVDFHRVRQGMTKGDWRHFEPKVLIRRFPDGYWGQEFSPFVPDHPYGSRMPHQSRRKASENWLKLLHRLSEGGIDEKANNWNALRQQSFQDTAYRPFSGIQPFLLLDHHAPFPAKCPYAECIDLAAGD